MRSIASPSARRSLASERTISDARPERSSANAKVDPTAPVPTTAMRVGCGGASGPGCRAGRQRASSWPHRSARRACQGPRRMRVRTSRATRLIRVGQVGAGAGRAAAAPRDRGRWEPSRPPSPPPGARPGRRAGPCGARPRGRRRAGARPGREVGPPEPGEADVGRQEVQRERAVAGRPEAARVLGRASRPRPRATGGRPSSEAISARYAPTASVGPRAPGRPEAASAPWAVLDLAAAVDDPLLVVERGLARGPAQPKARQQHDRHDRHASGRWRGGRGRSTSAPAGRPR